MTESKYLKAARELEDKFVSLGTDNEDVIKSFASAIASLEIMSAENSDPKFDLDAIAALATAFDMSDDVELQKEAEVLDDFLLSIASPKSALAAINMVYDKEFQELRAEKITQDREYKYDGVRELLDEMHNKKSIADAVKEQVSIRRPLEEPLSTRHSPDHPGVQLLRVTDNVYQDPMTGKMYDYVNGYVTDKGAKIPGSSVENQNPDTNKNQSRSMFTTREGLLNQK